MNAKNETGAASPVFTAQKAAGVNVLKMNLNQSERLGLYEAINGLDKDGMKLQRSRQTIEEDMRKQQMIM